MPALMNMPEVMANAIDATLSIWLKREGDTVVVGDPVAEVETEKATVEIEAETDGVIARLLVEEGASVEVGAPILVIKAPAETDSQVDSLIRDVKISVDAALPEVSSHTSTPTEIYPSEAAQTNAPGIRVTHTTEHPETPNPPFNQASQNHDGRIFSSPLARRMAKENQLDFTSIKGTGPGGRIIRRDVEQAVLQQAETFQTKQSESVAIPESSPLVRSLDAHAPATIDQQSSGTGPIAVPHTKMRRAIARRLTESKSTIPHFYLTAEVNMDNLLALRQQINASAARRITVNDLIVKAAGLALKDVPEANVTWSDEAQIQYSSADISVAIAIEGGLLTPVVRNVDALSLSSVSATISDFVDRAKAGKIRQEELVGGSFSITNLGMYGTNQFTAILNPPQSVILAVGAAESRAIVTDNELAVATMMTCTLSADHRVIDGAIAAQWMNAFKSRMESPLTILF